MLFNKGGLSKFAWLVLCLGSTNSYQHLVCLLSPCFKVTGHSALQSVYLFCMNRTKSKICMIFFGVFFFTPSRFYAPSDMKYTWVEPDYYDSDRDYMSLTFFYVYNHLCIDFWQWDCKEYHLASIAYRHNKQLPFKNMIQVTSSYMIWHCHIKPFFFF